MNDSKLVYCQHMQYVADQQAREWSKIALDLSVLLDKRLCDELKQLSANTARASASAPPAGAAPAQAEDPDRVRMQRRLAHVIRGLILMVALGMPRMLFYLYGAYSVLVLSGVTEHLQSAEFRRRFSGARPSLDLQLARLRQRLESLEKIARMEAAISSGEAVDDDEMKKEREFVDSFKSDQSWGRRFAYQLVFMFFYSALPACNPHPEFLV